MYLVRKARAASSLTTHTNLFIWPQVLIQRIEFLPAPWNLIMGDQYPILQTSSHLPPWCMHAYIMPKRCLPIRRSS